MSKEYDIGLQIETKEELLWLTKILDKNNILYSYNKDKGIITIHNLYGGI